MICIPIEYVRARVGGGKVEQDGMIKKMERSFVGCGHKKLFCPKECLGEVAMTLFQPAEFMVDEVIIIGIM